MVGAASPRCESRSQETDPSLVGAPAWCWVKVDVGWGSVPVGVTRPSRRVLGHPVISLSLPAGLSLNVEQVPRQHFLLAIGGIRHYGRESRCLSRNRIKDRHCLRHQDQQIFLQISLFHLWPGAFPWQPSLLAPLLSSAPPLVSAWMSYLPHPSPRLLLGLLQGLLLATLAAQHSTCRPFPRPFQVVLLFLFICTFKFNLPLKRMRRW